MIEIPDVVPVKDGEGNVVGEAALTREPGRVVANVTLSGVTWRGKRERARKKAEKRVAHAMPRSRTICAGKTGCSAKHTGGFYERPCIVCGKKTYHLRTVAAWDAPCCEDHDLARDYRVAVIIRPFSKAGDHVSFRAERKIEIVTQ